MQQAQRLVRRASRRQPLLPLLVPAVLAAVLAFALPVPAPDDGQALRQAAVFAEGATALASEDLASFRNNDRWGISLQEAQERAAERARQAAKPAEAAASNVAWSPELQAIGFVGVVITPAERVVLLTLPTGSVERFHVGDQLQDGRTLAAVSTQALALEHEDGERQTLALFPPPAAAEDTSGANEEN